MKYLVLKSKKFSKKLEEFVKKTKLDLDDFLGCDFAIPLIFFINNREEMDLIWGKKTEKWFVGASKNNSIYIFNPEVFASETTHDKKEFWQIFKHEYFHVYFSQITRGHYPYWLNEGLACYFSGKKLVLKDADKENLLNVFMYYDKSDKGIYAVGQFWVEYLIGKFGQAKMVELIKNTATVKNSHQFARLFNRVYGFKFNKNSFTSLIKSIV